MHEYATCNHCSERLKNKKRADYNQYRNVTLSRSSSSSSTSHINSDLASLQFFRESDSFIPESILDLSSDENVDKSNIQIADNPDALLYELSEVYDVISNEFEKATTFDEPVDFTFEIELDTELMEIASISQQLAGDRKAIKDKIRELSKYLIWPIWLVTIGKYATYTYVQNKSR